MIGAMIGPVGCYSEHHSNPVVQSFWRSRCLAFIYIGFPRESFVSQKSSILIPKVVREKQTLTTQRSEKQLMQQ